MPILSQLIALWHIKHTDIRTKTLAGYEETESELADNLKEMLHNSNESDKKYHEKEFELHNYQLKN